MTEISTITGKPFATFDEKMKLARGIFSHIRGNLFPSPGKNLHEGAAHGNPSRFINKADPEYQPSIYAEPEPDFSFGQSGAWKRPFSTYLQYLSKNPGSSLKNIVKNTDLSEYQAKTLMDLFKKNTMQLDKLPLE
jgi:hypothetical protein